MEFLGNPVPIVEWAHNGNVISRNTTDIDFVQTASTLVLTSANRDVNGIWTCHTLNEGLGQNI